MQTPIYQLTPGVAHSLGLPTTLAEFFDTYPNAIVRFGAVLRPLAGIVRHVMQSEGLDYSEARDYLVNEHFALCYDDYVAKYDQWRTEDYLSYCLTAFVYRVRHAAFVPLQRAQRTAARLAKGLNGKHSLANVRTITMSDSPIETHATIENHARLSTEGDQTRIAIMLEEHERELDRVAGVMSSLRELDSQVSYAVWQHVALGVTYADIGQALGVTALRAKALCLSGLAELRRLNQD